MSRVRAARLAELDPDAPHDLPAGLRPRAGVLYGCGAYWVCSDCYEPDVDDTPAAGGALRWIVVDRRDGFNLCARENLRAPFESRETAQALADHLNQDHAARPYRVICSDSNARYITEVTR